MSMPLAWAMGMRRSLARRLRPRSPAQVLDDNDGAGRPRLHVLRVLRNETADRRFPFVSAFDDAGRAVGAHPPQLGPVGVVVVVDEEGGERVGSDVLQPA